MHVHKVFVSVYDWDPANLSYLSRAEPGKPFVLYAYWTLKVVLRSLFWVFPPTTRFCTMGDILGNAMARHPRFGSSDFDRLWSSFQTLFVCGRKLWVWRCTRSGVCCSCIFCCFLLRYVVASSSVQLFLLLLVAVVDGAVDEDDTSPYQTKHHCAWFICFSRSNQVCVVLLM